MENDVSPFEAAELRRAAWRSFHGRMTDQIGFELPLREDVHYILDSDDAASLERSVSPQLLAEIRSTVPADVEWGLFHADSGRGASGYAIAWEVIERVGAFGGFVGVTVQTARWVKRTYGAIHQRLGRKPNVSLGAAIHLAAAELADRLDGAEDFQLYGAEDAAGAREDGAYTGEDLFLVTFARGVYLYLYAVRADGDVIFLQRIERSDPRGLFA